MALVVSAVNPIRMAPEQLVQHLHATCNTQVDLCGVQWLALGGTRRVLCKALQQRQESCDDSHCFPGRVVLSVKARTSNVQTLFVISDNSRCSDSLIFQVCVMPVLPSKQMLERLVYRLCVTDNRRCSHSLVHKEGALICAHTDGLLLDKGIKDGDRGRCSPVEGCPTGVVQGLYGCPPL